MQMFFLIRDFFLIISISTVYLGSWGFFCLFAFDPSLFFFFFLFNVLLSSECKHLLFAVVFLNQHFRKLTSS